MGFLELLEVTESASLLPALRLLDVRTEPHKCKQQGGFISRVQGGRADSSSNGSSSSKQTRPPNQKDDEGNNNNNQNNQNNNNNNGGPPSSSAFSEVFTPQPLILSIYRARGITGLSSNSAVVVTASVYVPLVSTPTSTTTSTSSSSSSTTNSSSSIMAERQRVTAPLRGIASVAIRGADSPNLATISDTAPHIAATGIVATALHSVQQGGGWERVYSTRTPQGTITYGNNNTTSTYGGGATVTWDFKLSLLVPPTGVVVLEIVDMAQSSVTAGASGAVGASIILSEWYNNGTTTSTASSSSATKASTLRSTGLFTVPNPGWHMLFSLLNNAAYPQQTNPQSTTTTAITAEVLLQVDMPIPPASSSSTRPKSTQQQQNQPNKFTRLGSVLRASSSSSSTTTDTSVTDSSKRRSTPNPVAALHNNISSGNGKTITTNATTRTTIIIPPSSSAFLSSSHMTNTHDAGREGAAAATTTTSLPAPTNITLVVQPHHHTVYCDRKRQVCTAMGAFREGNILSVAAVSDTVSIARYLPVAMFTSAGGGGSAGVAASSSNSSTTSTGAILSIGRRESSASSSLSTHISGAGALLSASSTKIQTTSLGNGTIFLHPTSVLKCSWYRSSNSDDNTNLQPSMAGTIPVGFPHPSSYTDPEIGVRMVQIDGDISIPTSSFTTATTTHSDDHTQKHHQSRSRTLADIFTLPPLPGLALFSSPAQQQEEEKDPMKAYGDMIAAISSSSASQHADSPLYSAAAALRLMRNAAAASLLDPTQFACTLSDVGRRISAVISIVLSDAEEGDGRNIDEVTMTKEKMETNGEEISGALPPNNNHNHHNHQQQQTLTVYTRPSNIVEAAPPRIREIWIEGEAKVHSTLHARTVYYGGVPGPCEYSWIRVDAEGNRSESEPRVCDPFAPFPPEGTPASLIDPRCRRITQEDVGCAFKVQCEPVREDGVKGAPSTSKPTPDCVQ